MCNSGNIVTTNTYNLDWCAIGEFKNEEEWLNKLTSPFILKRPSLCKVDVLSLNRPEENWEKFFDIVGNNWIRGMNLKEDEINCHVLHFKAMPSKIYLIKNGGWFGISF